MSTSTRASLLGGVLVLSALLSWHFIKNKPSKKRISETIQTEMPEEEEPSSQTLLNLLYCQSLEQSRLGIPSEKADSGRWICSSFHYMQ
jgi:hypothetical protein